MRAVIWGTGGTAVEVLRQKLLYSKYEIAAFTDSDPESWGKVFWRGIPVVPPEEMKEIYVMLIQAGSDYKKKDTFQKSCLDYAQEYSWRNGFIDIVRECDTM